MPAGLTDEQIANEERFLEGIPRLNIGALFLPPIWGPAHGFWASILFYPVWLFADNTFYAAWT
ncbi:MAG: viscotoxin-A3, partial [Gordonibacter sp.]